ncbi:MAG TPA: DNA-processing protein DprA [Candidatus Paceibacterota bacterium]
MLPPIEQLAPSEFPHLLSEIPDPPPVLFRRGNLPPSSAMYLCVVGSRKSTSYGKEVCRSLIESLGGYNIVIVSGLALGTDALAHEVALDTGLKTVAIPGSGLGESVLYPRTNYRLAERILSEGGTLLSEFPEDHRARPENFPQRNRIMAGMSHAILIIEAELRSGTMITARLATEYNRDVLTIPGSIFSPMCEGPHSLIRLGATPVRNGDDILEALHIEKEKSRENTNHNNLSDEEKIILTLLAEPLSRNELTELLKKPIHEANALISAMELKGLITERMGVFHII